MDILEYYREDYDKELFFSKINNKEAWGKDINKCCEWTAGLDKNGYGKFL